TMGTRGRSPLGGGRPPVGNITPKGSPLPLRFWIEARRRFPPEELDRRARYLALERDLDQEFVVAAVLGEVDAEDLALADLPRFDRAVVRRALRRGWRTFPRDYQALRHAAVEQKKRPAEVLDQELLAARCLVRWIGHATDGT